MDYKVVRVKFDADSLEVEIADKVIVKTGGSFAGFSVVEVVNIISNLNSDDFKRATKWIISKVDTSEYDAREEREEELIRLTAMYEVLAEKSPEFKKILDELTELKGK